MKQAQFLRFPNILTKYVSWGLCWRKSLLLHRYWKPFWYNLAIYPQIKSLVVDSFHAVSAKLNPSKLSHWFELFGYDFMITNDFNVLLIEVNTNPCLETPWSLLSSVVSSVLDNTFRITLDPMTYQCNNKTQELCDSSNNLWKFELVIDNWM